MINIVIDEKGYDIADDIAGISVHVNSDFSGTATMMNGNMIPFNDVRDFIDAALLIKSALTDSYGGYK